jgi:hypothetical protein
MATSVPGFNRDRSSVDAEYVAAPAVGHYITAALLRFHFFRIGDNRHSEMAFAFRTGRDIRKQVNSKMSVAVSRLVLVQQIC